MKIPTHFLISLNTSSPYSVYCSRQVSPLHPSMAYFDPDYRYGDKSFSPHYNNCFLFVCLKKKQGLNVLCSLLISCFEHRHPLNSRLLVGSRGQVEGVLFLMCDVTVQTSKTLGRRSANFASIHENTSTKRLKRVMIAAINTSTSAKSLESY